MALGLAVELADRFGQLGDLEGLTLDLGDRLDSIGYNRVAAAETIGAGYTTPEAMFEGWMDSASHRAVLLDPAYVEIGIGYVAGGRYGHYWTAVVAIPAP